MSAPLRVAVAAVGDPESPGTWSGVTSGVFTALTSLGVEAQAIDVTLPGRLEQALLAAGAARTRNRYDAEGAALTAAARSRFVRRKLGGAGAVDGVIQVGSTFSLPAGTRYVTLEDMTLRQATAVHPVFSRMSTATIAGWERRRAGIYTGAQMCAVSGHWAADSLVSDYGVSPAHIAVVGFGANHELEATAAQRQWQPARFLFVGIDWERKGGPQLLRAFSRVRETHPDATLDLVGGHPQIHQDGVTGHGVRSQADASDRRLMAELFARATCFVMPSQVEPFGIVHVEAAAAGIPSIGSSVGGPRDVIGEHGGAVVDPGDEAALLEAMGRLADPAVARKAGEAAHERSRLYTWTAVAERLLRALGLAAPDGRSWAQYL